VAEVDASVEEVFGSDVHMIYVSRNTGRPVGRLAILRELMVDVVN
jgi:hypothetical protein